MSDDYITEGAVKVVEIIGVSQESFEDAVQKGISKASQSIKGITGLEEVKRSAKVRDGKICEYHCTLKIAFGVR